MHSRKSPEKYVKRKKYVLHCRPTIAKSIICKIVLIGSYNDKYYNYNDFRLGNNLCNL